MNNMDIARVFNEEYSFKQNVLESLVNSNGSVSMEYCIFAEDHEPLTEEQQKIWDVYQNNGEIRLYVNIDLDELLSSNPCSFKEKSEQLKNLLHNSISFMFEQGLSEKEVLDYCGMSKEQLSEIGITPLESV